MPADQHKARAPLSSRGSRADGARGTRTPDLLGAIQALSQLSYSPGSGADAGIGTAPANADCSRAPDAGCWTRPAPRLRWPRARMPRELPHPPDALLHRDRDPPHDRGRARRSSGWSRTRSEGKSDARLAQAQRAAQGLFRESQDARAAVAATPIGGDDELARGDPRQGRARRCRAALKRARAASRRRSASCCGCDGQRQLRARDTTRDRAGRGRKLIDAQGKPVGRADGVDRDARSEYADLVAPA